MTFVRRLVFYLSGFAIGLVLLMFFLGGKNASCDYGPNARVLKNMHNKPAIFESSFRQEIDGQNIDSVHVSQLLRSGDVIFSKSEPRRKPCGRYLIEGTVNTRTIAVTVKNCDSLVRFLRVEKLE